jgi:hypothetical protein
MRLLAEKNLVKANCIRFFTAPPPRRQVQNDKVYRGAMYCASTAIPKIP